MGIEILEKKYQAFRQRRPECLAALGDIAERVSLVQLAMRALLDDITPALCSACRAPCCRCMPVEGWFTESDYFVFRQRYGDPRSETETHGLPGGCLFLGPSGCVLPDDMRPFPCVKVNCGALTRELAARGRGEEFDRLQAELNSLQQQVWPLLNDGSRSP